MKMELRAAVSNLSTNSDGSLTVSGYVNKTGQLSNILGVTKRFREKIAKSAFSNAINSSNQDIDFLADHDPKKILASTRNGSLEIKEDEQGLFMSATISATSWGKDYYQLIEDKILRNMSFGFRTVRDSWKKIEANLYERTIEELELFEVSVVKNPAYSQSTIAARGIDLVEEVKVPSNVKVANIETDYYKSNQEDKYMKTEHRYGNDYRNKREERKLEVREFNKSLRSLGTMSGHEAVIPEVVSEMIVEKLEESSQVFAKARKVPSVSGSVKIPRETSVGLASFVGEGKSLIEEALSLEEVTLTQKRAGAYIALTNQLINDSAMNMADYITNLLAKRTFKAIERSILQGSLAEEFAGIVPNIEIGKRSLSVTATDEELLEILLDMSLSIHPEYLQRSEFIMSRPFYNRVAKLKDAAGNYYVQNGIKNGRPTYTLFGLEVVITDSLDAGDVGGVPCIIGSLQDGYAVMVKKGAKMTTVKDSQHALQGSVGFLFDMYVDGQVYNPDALTKLSITS
ncbi:phage major capsid protein [Halobacillus karajensis]|uniref:Phage major capsid protein, HK97 family n=1 Tax=Halobacillus karajensis TaxID=195088 RepID=A0A024P7I8_9BACI|nr:phage major capsid protein [Halobacillus karajensis]CDQ21226.1 phage major capsid protein, HK97 family [Halobacillus karajensis]CDQ24713.1 phage major capsid protein, HK97 family [Halobacillus karajensis]CDQ28927.1 phage major capsid protein, HK97 family [Halobacillus karajensis]